MAVGINNFDEKSYNFKTEKEARKFAHEYRGIEEIVKRTDGTYTVNIINDSITDYIKIITNKKNESAKPILFVNDESDLPTKSLLSAPSGYIETRNENLSEGINFKEFESNKNSGSLTIRSVSISPENLNRLNIHFSREGTLNFTNLSKDSKNLVVMNGTFFTGTGTDGRTAGDIKGVEHGSPSSKQDKGETKGLITNSENNIRKEIDKRYTFAVSNNGKPVIFQGGLEKDNENKYQVALGGGVLLFNKRNSNLYKYAGTSHYKENYLQENDTRITSVGQGGDPARTSPRSAIGIMSDGSAVLINVGEGKYRNGKGGMTPSMIAKTMKEMGCISAIMLDGGGAPVMIAKDSSGKEITHTTPDIKGGYGNNKSVIIISK